MNSHPLSRKSAGSRCAIVVVLLLVLFPGSTALARGDIMPLALELLQPLSLQDHPLNWDELRAFYGAERFHPVWFEGQHPNRKAEQLRERLRRARCEGLLPQHYHVALIDSLWSSQQPVQQLQLELLLSSAFFDYARDVRGGRLDPEQVAPLWTIKREPVDAVAMLGLALLMDDFDTALDSLSPAHPAYKRLRTVLARYREIEALGGWPGIPQGEPIKAGITDPRVGLLRRHLQLVGDLTLPPAGEVQQFDKGLEDAVRRFQRRHGLTVDGVVGTDTLKALNVPVSRHIEQVIMTMERWRWLPHYLGRRHLIVNIPGYELLVFEEGEEKLTMPVIIGTRERPTPVTSGMLHSVVFNPYWTIPRKIAVEDIVPRQRREPDYMSSHKIRVYNAREGGEEIAPVMVDWRKTNVNHFPFVLRQDPGPKNALGKFKFLFNNRHDVYLHDTPYEGLFARTTRAYSSGCIRVQQPMRLAEYLLAGGEGSRWTDASIRARVRTGANHRVSLAARMPVYLLYLTVWVGADGTINFYRDVYGEDALLRPCLPFEEQSL